MAVIGVALIFVGCYLIYQSRLIIRSKVEVIDRVILPHSRRKIEITHHYKTSIVWPSFVLTCTHGIFLIALGIRAL